ncbi:MAG: hypothetical protein HPY45_04825 [Anaerolineae bacterium]|nr:hypothetical protein [Anaerolineae bacterium]
MAIYLLDNSLRVEIFFEQNDCDFADNICVSIREDCPDEEKLFRADETNIYITRHEAQQLITALLQAIAESDEQAL